MRIETMSIVLRCYYLFCPNSKICNENYLIVIVSELHYNGRLARYRIEYNYCLGA